MILSSSEFSTNQQASLEPSRTRSLQDSPAERQSAAEQMRHQLWMLDPSERRMSIEDYAAALLEKSRSDCSGGQA